MALLAFGPSVRAEEAVADGVGRSAKKQAGSLAADFLRKHEAPGLSVAYARRGRMIYVATFGASDAETGEPLRTDQMFRIASVSKPITATAVMLLVERGRIRLEDKVFGAGGLLDARVPVPSAAPSPVWLEEITVDHLLTHTAGGWPNDGADPMFRFRGLDQDRLIRVTLETRLLKARPGSGYAYSNFGYCLLGRVIEEVSGEGYEPFVIANVLAPCGAGAMRVGANSPAPTGSDEVRYASNGRFDPYSLNVRRMDAHGGWIGTASDLVRFIAGVDGYSSVADILRPETIELMSERRTESYARGWQVNPNHRNRWHNGLMPGTASIAVRIDGDSCFAGLVNARGLADDSIVGDLDRLMWDIYGAVMG